RPGYTGGGAVADAALPFPNGSLNRQPRFESAGGFSFFRQLRHSKHGSGTWELDPATLRPTPDLTGDTRQDVFHSAIGASLGGQISRLRTPPELSKRRSGCSRLSQFFQRDA